MDRRRLLMLSAFAALAPNLGLASEPAKEDRKKGGGLTFLQLPTLTATVMRMGGKRGVLTVDMGLDIPDDNLREKAELWTPRLRAAYVQTLNIYAAGLPAARAPDADYIAMMLQRTTNTMLATNGAKLLLGAILIN
jgi:hypothetical protein